MPLAHNVTINHFIIVSVYSDSDAIVLIGNDKFGSLFVMQKV